MDFRITKLDGKAVYYDIAILAAIRTIYNGIFHDVVKDTPPLRTVTDLLTRLCGYVISRIKSIWSVFCQDKRNSRHLILQFLEVLPILLTDGMLPRRIKCFRKQDRGSDDSISGHCPLKLCFD